MREFEKNPFPNPKRYAEIATQFDMRSEEVQSFYNTERLKYVKKYGPYEGMEEVVKENVSDALWDLAKLGKQVNQERRQRVRGFLEILCHLAFLQIAKRFGVSYITISFWLDNYISQIKCGTAVPTTKRNTSSTTTKC